MKKNIAIIAGGNSSEFPISIKSAGQIVELLNPCIYNTRLIVLKGKNWTSVNEDGTEVKVDLNDFSLTLHEGKIIFDYAFIIIHGNPGEDGKLQAYFEMMGIPYNTCNVLCSALTFNKFACKSYLRNFGVLTAESIVVKKGAPIDESAILAKAGLPCFVKPNNGGSSFGTSKVTRQEDLLKAIELAFKEDPEVIIEAFVKGDELSCGLLKTSKEEFIFPVTEIVTKNEFFDFEAKYTPGITDEITPARVSVDIQKKVQNISSEVYDLLNCRGLVRVDFIVRGNQIYFLELNTVPGMSKESIVPKQIEAAGLKMEDVLEKIIEEGI